jgi:hypothetical protein
VQSPDQSPAIRDRPTQQCHQHRPHRSQDGAAPLKLLPEPVELDLYRIRRRAHFAGMINEYHLVA